MLSCNLTRSLNCPPPKEPDTYHRVLYNFSAQMEGDMTAAEGEVVLVVEKKSAEGDWVVVENSQVINMGSNIPNVRYCDLQFHSMNQSHDWLA